LRMRSFTTRLSIVKRNLSRLGLPSRSEETAVENAPFFAGKA
jgi:hypothetical protein